MGVGRLRRERGGKGAGEEDHTDREAAGHANSESVTCPHTTMNNSRRGFLTSSLAASAVTAVSTAGPAAAAPRQARVLRAARLPPEARNGDLLAGRVLREGVPAGAPQARHQIGWRVHRAGGQQDRPDERGQAGHAHLGAGPPRQLESFVTVSAELNTDPAVLKGGAEYLQSPKSAPAFERIDSWLLLAFKGHPTMTLPEFSKKRVPTRVFEMRDYESHSELKALAKMAMFNEGEIEIMRDLGMSPCLLRAGALRPEPAPPALHHVGPGSRQRTSRHGRSSAPIRAGRR